MIPAAQLDRFVTRVMQNLSDSLKARTEDLETLLELVPSKYPRRGEIRMALEAIRTHEAAQKEFCFDQQPGRDGHNGGK